MSGDAVKLSDTSAPASARLPRRFDAWRFLLLLSTAFAPALGVVVYLHARTLAEGGAPAVDFVVLWAASKTLLDGGGVAALLDVEAFKAAQSAVLGAEAHQFWLYPPNYLILIAPLALAPYGASFALWSVLGLAAYVAAMGFGRDPATSRRVAFLAVASPATIAALFHGQNGLFTAALLVGAFRLLDRRPVLAGVLLGLLAFKPQLGLLAPVALIAAGRWSTAAAATATAAALAGASVWALGVDAWTGYFDKTMPLQSALLAHGSGPFQLMAPTVFMAARLNGLSADLGYAVQIASFLAAAIVVFRTFRRADIDPELRNAVLFAATFLATPYALNYDLAPLAAGVIAAAASRRGNGMGYPGAAVLTLAWIAPVLVLIANFAGVTIGPLLLAASLLTFLRLARRGDGFSAVAPAS